MQEEAKQTVLDMKFACIIETFSKEFGVTLEEATGLFYNSQTMSMIERGVADMHCRSDKYLAEELWLEIQEKNKSACLEK